MNSKVYQPEVRSAVLLNTFLIEKKRFRVFYNNGLLIWEEEKSKNSKYAALGASNISNKVETELSFA